MSIRPKELVLFFTRGVSLRRWDDGGIFEREVAIYRRLQELGIRVSFVTYGGPDEREFQSRIPGIKIICNRFRWNRARYERWLHLIHGLSIQRADVIKTNQVKGGELALRAAIFWRKPLVARCGYMWSSLAAASGPRREREAETARRAEARLFNAAERIVVTTSTMRDYVVQTHGEPIGKVTIIPNYVLTDLFSPSGRAPVANRLCFVGRLSLEKNPLALVQACAGLDVELLMIGEGPLREDIVSCARRLKVRVWLPGNIPHAEIAPILRDSAIFLLASPHEGHPKALIEAMASGVPVIGVDAPGIRELIQHGENGWCCGTDPASIRNAIEVLLSRPRLCERLGSNARRFVVERFALDAVVEKEIALLHEVAKQ